MAIPVLIPIALGALSTISKDKKLRKMVTIAALITGGIVLYPLIKKRIQISIALSPVTVTPLTDKPLTVPANAEILARLYSWGGLENFIMDLKNKGIQIVKVTTMRKGRIFVIDPKAIVWISKDGKTAYAEYITYV